MKAFTDPEQSKLLVKILLPESADMAYWKRSYRPNDYAIMAHHTKELQEGFEAKGMEYIPCWSLAALFGILPDELIDSDSNVYRIEFFHLKGKYIIQYSKLSTLWPSLFSVESDNSVDACVEMILKLKENNLI